jgi:DNA helicase II / ATP-dependent DNA helicase PcrA
MELTDEQRAFVEGDGGVFSQACPGSGKTRAIVGRYLRRTGQEPRRGVALISFTRVAIDEVKARCSEQWSSLDAPHFVGTFDTFINRFLSGPLYARTYQRHLEFVESWDKLPSAWLSSGKYPINLEWFDFDAYGRAAFCPERVDSQYAPDIIKRVRQNLSTFCSRAEGKRKSLLSKSGVASCSASRWFAVTQLAHQVNRDLMSGLLANRFAEIIVDEAQDCGKDELAILAFLRDAGVKVTLVADRDQAIFEFRRAIPQELAAFVDTLTSGPALTGNFRSSPAICKLNDSLRFGPESDSPTGSYAANRTPVQLVAYQNINELPTKFRAVASQNGVDSSDLIVLAHARSHACLASGSVVASNVGEQKVVRIADAARILRARQADPRLKLRAIERVEWIVLGRANDQLTEIGTLEAACEAAGIEPRWLRDAAFRTAMAGDPTGCDRTEYTDRVRTVINGFRYPAGLSLASVTQYLKTPSDRQWAKLDRTSPDDCLNWGTIHSVKGQEFEAVALVIPRSLRKDGDDRNVIDHWETGTDSEPRRVLYVGASRAQRLLILAVHSQYSQRVRTILERDDVPFEVAGRVETSEEPQTLDLRLTTER